MPANVLAGFRAAYNASGWKGYLQKRLDHDLELSKQAYVSPAHLAEMYALLGDKDRALEWLEKAYQEHDAQLAFWIRIGADLDTLRPDPRFKALLARMNLTP